MIETQQPTIWGVGIVFSIVAILSVTLRFQARRIMASKLESDDWTILLALILGIGVTIDVLIMTQHGGLGTHSRYDDDGNILDVEAMITFNKTIYALGIITWPALGMTKISVLLMYKRIFATPRFGIIAWILVGVIAAWAIAFTFAMALSCTPIESQWFFDLPHSPSTCVNVVALFITALATDVATDSLVLLLPIYKIRKLQMPFARKVMIACIFLLGSLVSFMGLIRIYYSTKIYHCLEDSFKPDVTWNYSATCYWTIIEVNVGVLSACLPTLRPVQECATQNLSRLRRSATHLFSSFGKKTKDLRSSRTESLNLVRIESSRTSEQSRVLRHL
ncbi:hypothetical protein F5Y04DRAFT_289700 [Hypomontagnella monticulosa]|nr:hypothetical protein F5Y04DRAFT_289700 [Hypomontagnella monticulosa]